jgi:serine/threonine protein kinase
VIHRDIKPQNILLSKTGEAKVADFGIARAATATTMTQAGSVMGTVHYISPEQALGEPATPKSDLYSLGVVLYEMLTGELPYDAETPAGVVMKHVGGLSRSPKEANAEVPKELDAVTARLLAKDPDHRYPDGNALVEDLERVKEGLQPTAETMRARTRVRRAGRLQRRGVLITLALVLASVGVIAAVALSRGGLLAEKPQSLPKTEPGQVTAPLPPGRYATEQFDPGLSFSIEEGDGWRVSYPDTSDNFELTTAASTAEAYSRLGFSRAEQVFAPNSQDLLTLTSDDRTTPAPEDMVTWLRNHPSLNTSKAVPVTVGGEEGVRLDASVSPTLEDYSLNCGPEPCVFLLKFSDENGLPLYAGDKNRLIVLEDVGGKTVVITVIGGPAEKFGGFLPKAQEVLDTVEWETAS